MNSLKLASLVSAALACLAPFAWAQSEPGQTHRTDVKITYQKYPLAGKNGMLERARPQRQEVEYPLGLFLTVINEDAFRLEVDPIDEAPAWIVVCLDTGEGLVPVAVLDARNDGQCTIQMPPEAFRQMPLALFGVRVSPDGFIEFSQVKSARELVEDARQS